MFLVIFLAILAIVSLVSLVFGDSLMIVSLVFGDQSSFSSYPQSWRSYEPLPSVFPDPSPMAQPNLILVSFTSKFTGVLTSITSKFTTILGIELHVS